MSSDSESDVEDDGRNISDGSSQQEDEEPTITSRKNLFKRKGKGEGKSSQKCSAKGKPHLTIAQKVRNLCVIYIHKYTTQHDLDEILGAMNSFIANVQSYI